MILVLGASLAVHLVLIFGLHVKVAQQAGRPQVAMEVRIERMVEAESKDTLSTILPDKTEKPMVVAEVTPRDEVATPKSAARPASPEIESSSSLLPALEMPLIEDPTYYPAKQLDLHPVALDSIKPAYPEKGVELGVDGKVILLLLVDEGGVVKDASVVEADPEGIFEESALTAFRNARFAPAQKNGRAVKSRVLIRVSYEMNDRKKPVAVQPPMAP